MNKNDKVAIAKKLAEKAHQGQVDKAGKPYIHHPERVASRVKNEEEQVVAWLHDVVEDTSIDLSEIEALFGEETACAVKAITRKNNEDWESYLLRVKANETARKVKISDLIDNSNLSRIENVSITDVLRQEKYNQALQFLIREDEKRQTDGMLKQN